MDELKSWSDILSGWGDKYLEFRRVQTQDAIQADRLRYEQEAARVSAAQAQQSQGWIMPALLIGGGVLVLFLVLKS